MPASTGTALSPPPEPAAAANFFLVTKDGEQIELLEPEQTGEIEVVAGKTEAKYTAQKLLRDRPRVFNLVARLLAEGQVPWREITKATGCHHYTLQAVVEYFPALLEAEKKSIGRAAQSLSRMCVERMVELVPNMGHGRGDFTSLGVVFGISVEKSQLLLGGPTSRIERTQPDEYLQLKQVYEDIAPLSGPDTGCGAGDGEIKGAEAERPAATAGGAAGRPPAASVAVSEGLSQSLKVD